jgi:hypothetical protein
MLLLTITILMTVTFLPSPTVKTQQTGNDEFPKPYNPAVDQSPKRADYPDAGKNCEFKQQLAPFLTMIGAGPTTKRCSLSVYNCRTDKTDEYQSAPRESEAVSLDCNDYEDIKAALGRIEICCDCARPTPWFDTSPRSGCKEVKEPQLTISGGSAILYMCRYPVFHYTSKHLLDPDLVEVYRAAVLSDLQYNGLAKVCCDKFKEAVRTGKPCDPRSDVDCDGVPNKSDVHSTDGQLPKIDGKYTVGPDAKPDAFPTGMTVDAILPPAACEDCKWVLTAGKLKCNPDKTKRHEYEATWRCPTTKEVVPVTKLSAPGARCDP